MCLAGRGERLLDPEVHLQAAATEPAPSASGQHRRLLELVQAEEPAPERATLLLAARRDRQLDVVEHPDLERHAAHHPVGNGRPSWNPAADWKPILTRSWNSSTVRAPA